MGVRCKDKQVKAAAHDNPALGRTSLDNSWFRAFKQFKAVFLCKLRCQTTHESLVGFGIHRDKDKTSVRNLEDARPKLQKLFLLCEFPLSRDAEADAADSVYDWQWSSR